MCLMSRHSDSSVRFTEHVVRKVALYELVYESAKETPCTTRVQALHLALSEMREDSHGNTVGQVLRVEGYPDIFQERQKLDRVRNSKAFHCGTDPTALLDVLPDPCHVARGNKPRSVVQPLHPIVLHSL